MKCNIPREITPLFAIEIVGWSAHRLEELITTDKIIRPAYKSEQRICFKGANVWV